MLVYIAVLYGIIRFFAPPFDSPSRLWFAWGMISAIALLTLALASYSGADRPLWARAIFAITFGFVVVLISLIWIPMPSRTTSNETLEVSYAAFAFRVGMFLTLTVRWACQ